VGLIDDKAIMKMKLNLITEHCGQKRSVFFLLFLLVLTFSVTIPQSVSAVGFRLPNQDPEAIARGNAFAATADDPSAIYYNPAGITQLKGLQVSAGLYVISADTKYSSSSGSAETDATPQPVPQIYCVDSFTNLPISVGLGIYAPYGLSLDWGKHTPFNTVAESGSLLYASINPVIAWRICKTLSLAAGPTINYSQAVFRQALDPTGATQFKFYGDGLDYGFNVGILWQPHPMWSFGVNYHSSTTINYDGTVTVTPGLGLPAYSSANASINFPQYVVGGVSFRPTTKWNLEFDIDWTEWSVDKDITFQDPSVFNPSVTLDYRDSFMYEFGVTRQLGRGYFASVGYIYSENSSPDAHFNPLIPDANLQLGGIGFGHRGQHWNWMIAYQFAYNGGRTVSNDATPQADGTYKTFNNAFNINATYKF
jgi:long-chain fatty acid transport protein